MRYKNVILQGEPVISKIPCANSTNTLSNIFFDEQREQYLSMETMISETIEKTIATGSILSFKSQAYLS
jgi:hypothetical protein